MAWICDTCGQPITEAEHGWVEWLIQPGGGRHRAHGLRLVHHRPYSPRAPHGRCQYDNDNVYENFNAGINDRALRDFLGPDGLMDLLAFLHDEEFSDKGEVLQMIKRLHIPGYEQAFRYFDMAINDGAFEPNTIPNYYSQNQINAVIAWIRNQEL